MSSHESNHEEWRECSEWLNEFRVIPGDHITLSENGNAINLLQTLQDGVILCNLCVNISGGEIDLKSYNDFNPDPQNSQFLCCHNIKLFLDLCENYFKIDKSYLFNVNDLYQANNFGKVISLLSQLSNHELAISRQIQPFSTKGNTCRNQDSKQSHKENNNLTTYTLEDTIYDTVLYQGHAKKLNTVSQSTITPRDYCIKEIVDTEKNYVDLLNMLLEKYKKPLKKFLSEQELDEIFKHIDKLYYIHRELYRNLLLATQPDSPPFTISHVFIKIRDSLLLYGEYSGHLMRAKSLVRDIVNNDEEKRRKIDQCRENADDKCKFELVELLTVPMQRVLKYHLLLEQLCKLTPQDDPDKSNLLEAHSAMKDLADFTNEVKRDLDMINSINRIQECLEDLYFPANKSLRSYGRLQMDGELRISVDNDCKIRIRYVFLFDRMFLICKQKGPNYTFMKAYFVATFPSENIDAPMKKNNKQWTFGFRMKLLTEKDHSMVSFYAKSEEIRASWLKAINIAKTNICPPGARENNYFFELFDFPDYAYCSICKKILKGSFFQGYRCKLSGIIAHKECLAKNELKPLNNPLALHSNTMTTHQTHLAANSMLNLNQIFASTHLQQPTGFTNSPNKNIANSSQILNNFLLPTGNCVQQMSESVTPTNIANVNNNNSSSGYSSNQISRNISNVSSNAGDSSSLIDDIDVTKDKILSNNRPSSLLTMSNLRRRSSTNDSSYSATPPGSIGSQTITKQGQTPNQSPLHSNHSSVSGSSLAIVLRQYTNTTVPEYQLAFGETVNILQVKQNQILIQKDNRLEFWVPSSIVETVQALSEQHKLNGNLNLGSVPSQQPTIDNLSFDNANLDFQSPFCPPHLTSNSNRSHSRQNHPSSSSGNQRRHTTDFRVNPPKNSYIPQKSTSISNPAQMTGIFSTQLTPKTCHFTSQLQRLTLNEDITSQTWFLGSMDRNEAASLLQNCDNGTFLVRVSQNHERLGEFSLSLVFHEPRHIRIYRKYSNQPNNQINNQSSPSNQSVIYFLSQTRCFPSITTLIEHYKRSSLESCFDGINTCLLYPYIRCPNLVNPILAQVTEEFSPDEDYETISQSQDLCQPISLLMGEIVVIMNMELEKNGYIGFYQGWRRGRIGIFPKNNLTLTH